MNNSSSLSTGESSSENCENCSSSFSLFKRKKICNFCKQAFCQSCVNRQTFSSVLNNRNSSQQNSNSSSERICVICQSICSPQTTVDDLMKLKLKHLRSILNNANIATSTCKEKRDLVDLVLRNRLKFQNLPQQQQARPSQSTPQPPPPQQQTPPPPPQNSTFNDTFSSFMNNVQDFVNFNLNSALNQAQPAPAPPSTSSNSTNNNNNKKTFTQSTTNFNINGQPSGSTTSQMPSSSSSASNLNSLFNIIGEQVPNVLQQTFTNNRFTFNNVFNGANQEERRGSTSSNTSNRQATPPSPTPQAAQATPEPEPQPKESEPVIVPKRRASLSDVKSENDIENLTIKQIKEILAINFVDYKGCCEKKELVEKAKRLFKSNENNKRLEKEITSNENNESSQSASSTTAHMPQENKKTNADESDLCKICMESLIDCVLLDCGHMVSCTKCGKRLAECPICRQNVIRVIRVFKS